MKSNFIQPPVAPKKDHLLTAHGETRNDPYFWMRLSDKQKSAARPDKQTQEVLNYLNEENTYTDAILKSTEALQNTLYEEITGRIKQTDKTVPYFKNGYWYYTRHEEGKEYPIYCRKKDSLENEEEILINCNELAKGHEYYVAVGLKVSHDNKILAYAEDTVGRRIYTYKFKNLETGENLNDFIENAEAGGAWGNDNQTFFYTSKNKITLLSEKVWRHQLGQEQATDELVYEEKDETFYIGVYKSNSDQYIIIWNQSTLVSDYHILDANNPQGKFHQFTPREYPHEYSLEHYKDKFYILTNWDALNFRLMETSINQTNKNDWQEVIPHRPDVLLSEIEVFDQFLVINERYDDLTRLKIINQNSREEHYIQFDEEAYTVYSGINPEFDTEILRFRYTSLTTPLTTYDYNMNTRKRELRKRQEINGGHQPEDYITERKFATSVDGVRIPISIVYNKNTAKSRSTPLLLYGYGSYGHSEDPFFNPALLSLLDRGFIYAIAHIRGGQEMGRQWYEDGKMFNKKNTFNDFIDCAQYLIKENFTSKKHLYAMGRSAGGLLMGAVVNISPQLFNGIIAGVPFVDVITTMLDETIPHTTSEFDEWGNPKNIDSYQYMLSYSPYDQVKEQAYPNMLVTSGYFDSEVQYWEPTKWVALLREKKTDDNLLLLHTNMEAGHVGASGRFKQYKEIALHYAFFLMLEENQK